MYFKTFQFYLVTYFSTVNIFGDIQSLYFVRPRTIKYVSGKLKTILIIIC